jgi:hypothetical protein
MILFDGQSPNGYDGSCVSHRRERMREDRTLRNMMEVNGSGFAVRFGRSWLVWDDVGLHAVWRGRGVAWTRNFGWVWDE